MYYVTVSIVTNNSEKLIERCLSSISGAIVKYSYRTVVLDNASSDSTIEIIKRDFSDIQLIEKSEKRGFGANQNTILRDSLDTSKYILVLNDDVILSPGSVDGLIDFLEGNQLVGAVCPLISYPDGTLQVSGGYISSIGKEIIRKTGIAKIMSPKLKHNISRLPPTVKSVLGKSINSYLDNLQTFEEVRFVDYLSGACLLSRSDVLSKVGLFDERFFMYYEDLDLGIRMTEAGWKMVVLSTQKVIHYTKSSWGYVSHVESERSMFNYYAKYNTSLPSMFLLSLITVLYSFLCILLGYIIFLFDGDPLYTRKKKILAHKSIMNMGLRSLSKIGCYQQYSNSHSLISFSEDFIY
jgi:GT2 family glycosyltransferase